ncbi:F-box protein [Platanthera guangdongensis]|uniref:F-box protein n=1 Tax=Platanthera guangdongensis TaxID=2320717 RepID=A0ABR2M8C4_9ASPA
MQRWGSSLCCYLPPEPSSTPPPENQTSRRRDAVVHRKRSRVSRPAVQARDFFDGLPDDIVLLILTKISASAGRPSDIIFVLLTCRRLNCLATSPMVLSKISRKGTGLRAKFWTESAHRFLKLCADAGSVEACYTLGMIYFYCLEYRRKGINLMARAAMRSHPEALYSLSVIQFNGSGGLKNDKDLRAGVALCARAAYLGHMDALRELGHCLQDGYGVRQNIIAGRRFLFQANARELAAVLGNGGQGLAPCSLFSDFGCSVPAAEGHPANRFLLEWFEERGGAEAGWKEDKGIRMCSHFGCGRPETRRHEFRRCSVCGVVNYCSRACQALHWKLAHKEECFPMNRWLEEVGGFAGENAPAPGVIG